MTVDADMEEEEEEEVAAPWSEKERRHIAQSFKQRSLATLPLRFSSKTAVAAIHRCTPHVPPLDAWGAGECSIMVQAFSRIMEAKKPAHK